MKIQKKIPAEKKEEAEIHKNALQDGRVGEAHTFRHIGGSAQKIPTSDAAVWSAFRKGDEEALIYIYKEYANKMYNYGCRFTCDKALVSDSIQELFTEIISNKKNLGDTVSIKFYLFKALRRKLLRALKHEKKYLASHDEARHQGFNIQEDSSIRFIYQESSDHQKSIITQACNQLPCKQREALLLYFYEGMSYQEIAQTMGMTRVKSARALIYRAIDSLSVHLQHYKDMLYPLWPLLFSCLFF